jgi:hypothetical protein
MSHAQRQSPPALSKSSDKAPNRAKASSELSLETMLADEIVQLTMASDGVTPEEVRALVRITPLYRSEHHPD